MTSVLIETPEREKLHALRAFAERRENWREVTLGIPNVKNPADDERHVVLLASGLPEAKWKVVFTIDLEEMIGPAKHMSMSLVGVSGVSGRAPSSDVLEEVGRELGIVRPYVHMGPLFRDPESVIHLISFHTDEAAGAGADQRGAS